MAKKFLIAVLSIFICLMILFIIFLMWNPFYGPRPLPEPSLLFMGGKATVTIEPVVEVQSSTSVIDFGRGYVSTHCSQCFLSTQHTNVKQDYRDSCCVGFTSPHFGILLENTGNRNISLNYSCLGACSAQQFLGGTSPHFQLTVTPDNIHTHIPRDHPGYHDTEQSCTDATGGTKGYLHAFEVDLQGAWLCGNSTSFPLSPKQEADGLVVDVHLTIPSDAQRSSASRKATFIFTAHSSTPISAPALDSDSSFGGMNQ